MMKKALKFGGIGLVVLTVAFIGIAFLLPRHVVVERDTVVDATPKEVFPYVNSLRRFNEWSPWAEIDPNTKYTFSGPDSGVGAKMKWESDHQDVGSGTQEIVKSEPNSRTEAKLNFGEQGTARSYFELEPRDGKANVTWGLRADMGNNPIARWMGLKMDDWVGSDYEKGLANLKGIVESQ